MTSVERDLARDEQLLEGAWVGDVAARTHDDVDRRILWLVSRRLTLVAVGENGWRQLFRDPRDGRLWELSFPHGSLHGGGPRRLECVTAPLAHERFGLPLD